VPDAIETARTLIESRLAEIDDEAKQFEQAPVGHGRRSNGGRRRGVRPRRPATTAAVSAPGPKRLAARGRKAGKRAPRGQRGDELLAAIKADPGARPADLARQIRSDPSRSMP
jgi:hypothetical protein